jgi:phosphohistidine phosphatase
MTLYIIRHGIAEEAAPGGDAERKLTQKGTFQVAMVAKGLRKLDLTFDRIVASPFTRARETAEIVARITEHGKEILFDKRLLPSTRFQDVSDLIAENSDAGSLLLVGHQPAIGEIIGGLCTEGTLGIEVKPASITAISIDRLRPLAKGALLWSMPPKVLKGIAK